MADVTSAFNPTKLTKQTADTPATAKGPAGADTPKTSAGSPETAASGTASTKDPAADSKQAADTPATAKGPAGADTPKTPAGSPETAAPGTASAKDPAADSKQAADTPATAKGPAGTDTPKTSAGSPETAASGAASAKDPAADSKQAADTPATAKGPAGTDTPKTSAGSPETAAPGTASAKDPAADSKQTADTPADSDAKLKGDAKKEAKGSDTSADEFASATVKDAITAEAALASSMTTPTKTTQDQAKASVEKATQAFSKDAQDKAGRARLTTALTGKTADQLSDAQRKRVDSFLDGVGKDGVQGIETRAAATAPPEGESQQTPDTALPDGVQAAATRSAEGKDQILISTDLDEPSRDEAASEEVGEVIARRAKDAGIEVAPGDVGARLVNAQQGVTATFESDPDIFVADAGDRTSVTVDGKVQEASARGGIERNLGRIRRAGSDAAAARIVKSLTPLQAYNVTARLSPGLVAAAERTATNMQFAAAAIRDLENNSTAPTSGSSNEVAEQIVDRVTKGLKKSLEALGDFKLATRSHRQLVADTKEFQRSNGLGARTALALRAKTLERVFNPAFVKRDGSKAPIDLGAKTVREAYASLEKRLGKAVGNVSRFLKSEVARFDGKVKFEKAERLTSAISAIVGTLAITGGALGIINSGAAAIAKGAKAVQIATFAQTAVEAGFKGEGLRAAVKGLQTFAARALPNTSEPVSALSGVLDKSPAGKAIKELVQADYEFRKKLFTSSARYFDLVGTKFVDRKLPTFGGSRIFNNAGAKAEREIRRIDTGYGSQSTYRTITTPTGRSFGGDGPAFYSGIESWYIEPLLPNKSSATLKAEAKARRDVNHGLGLKGYV